MHLASLEDLEMNKRKEVIKIRSVEFRTLLYHVLARDNSVNQITLY